MHLPTDPLIPNAIPQSPSPSPSPHPTPALKTKVPWIPLAAASGACAAFNGVFAKLTTTELTTTWAAALSTTLNLSSSSKSIEYLIRASFFALNLAFNALMWALFTTALTRASSTTRVSIINTSANFMLTALAGWMVFGEGLPGLWWVGAAGLVVGNVVIGRREEEGDGGKVRGRREGEGLDGGGSEERREGYRDREGEGDGDGAGGAGNGDELGSLGRDGVQR